MDISTKATILALSAPTLAMQNLGCMSYKWIRFACVCSGLQLILFDLFPKEREQYQKRRYDLVKDSGGKIHSLVSDNVACFKSEESSDHWKAYVEYLDEMVVEGFFHCIGCSLNYLLDNTDLKNRVSPLFEARLELQAPDMVFVPSLDYNVPNGFYELIDGIVTDIYHQSTLVNRLASHNGHSHYQVGCNPMHSVLDVECSRKQNLF